MKEFESHPYFGEVFELKCQDYIKEVNQAPKNVYVIIHLYINSKPDCVIFDQIKERPHTGIS